MVRWSSCVKREHACRSIKITVCYFLKFIDSAFLIQKLFSFILLRFVYEADVFVNEESREILY